MRNADGVEETRDDREPPSSAHSASTEEVSPSCDAVRAFVMVSHVKPDGDTLGAGFALGLALRPLGKRVHYFQEGCVPRNLRFLPDAEQVSARFPPICRRIRCGCSAT